MTIPNKKILVIDKLKNKGLKKIKNNFFDGIIAVNGPDSFSISRSNVAIANTLSFIWKLPVAGINRKEFKNKKELIAIGMKKLRKTKVGKFIKPIYNKEPNIT